MGRRELGSSDEIIRAGDPIPVRLLFRETVRLLTGTWSKTWPAWLGVLVAYVLVYLVAAVFAEPLRGLPEWGASVLTVAEVLATAVPYAFGIRVALNAARPLAIDKGLAGFVGVYVAGAVIIAVWALIPSVINSEQIAAIAFNAGLETPADGNLIGVLYAAYLASFLVITVAVVFLSLWPIALLMREPDASPAKSWRDMRGAVFPVIVMFVLAGVLVETAVWAFKSSLSPYALGDEPSLLNEFVSSVAYYPTELILTGVYAAVWLVRAGDGRRRLAAFD